MSMLMGCPHCGKGDRLAVVELVPVATGVHSVQVTASGEYSAEWDGDTDRWDECATHDVDSATGDEQWWCRRCREQFGWSEMVQLAPDPFGAWLADGGYSTVEDWAADSDYVLHGGEWYTEDDTEHAYPLDIEQCAVAAMEASRAAEV